ncbi:MAG: cupin domain-containing protein [Lachnospiraceae bacterium]|nr:cupin domain-containing protein [Lachnospiraceae bacterium]
MKYTCYSNACASGCKRRAASVPDYGPEPACFNIEYLTDLNTNFRTTIWTGEHLQVTLMNINPGEDIGLEIHNDFDQFLRIENGLGLVKMGSSPSNMCYQAEVCEGNAILVPAGTYHNLINLADVPLKLYSIYAPPAHRPGTVHETKEEAEKEH